MEPRSSTCPGGNSPVTLQLGFGAGWLACSIYQMLAEGNSNKEIAARLNLSLHTVQTHRTHIMEKLGVHSAAELVLSAVRRGADRLKAAGNTATAVVAAAPAEPTIPLE